jgi:hypothetical protein
MEELIQATKILLANHYSFYLKAHYYHWNITGPNFPQYHEFLENIYTEVYGVVDKIAEEIRAMDAYAPGSFQRFIQLSQIQGDDSIPMPEDMLRRLLNDIDTMPYNKNLFNYETTENNVKHFYGYQYALGGIVVMKGSDFEKTNGFPCFWGWGMEDNVLQKRCENMGLTIDRSTFYNIGSPEILQLFDGISRIISKKDPWRGKHDNGMDGLKTITQLKYTIDDKSHNPSDNIFSINNPNIFIINISTFLTYIKFGSEEYYNYDLREPKRKIIHPDKFKETTKTVVNTTDWSNIPHYPTTLEKSENLAKYLISMGKQVPQTLLKQIQDGKNLEIKNDVYNTPYQAKQYENPIIYNRKPPVPHKQVPHKFSPQYAAHVGVKPRASASARIGLGGAF